MSERNRMPERCYCGDPECKNCFPFSSAQPDEDAEYEIVRQQEIDGQRLVRVTITGESALSLTIGEQESDDENVSVVR